MKMHKDLAKNKTRKKFPISAAVIVAILWYFRAHKY